MRIALRESDGRGYYRWTLDGEIHREGNLPALRMPDGTIHYMRNGQYHRDDGPAYINLRRKVTTWWQHGKRHRLDGPAYISLELVEYWIDGDKVAKIPEAPP